MGVFSKDNLKSAGRIFGNLSGGPVLRREERESTYPRDPALSGAVRALFLLATHTAYAIEKDSRRHSFEPDQGLKDKLHTYSTIGGGLMKDAVKWAATIALSIPTGGVAGAAFYATESLVVATVAEIGDRRDGYRTENLPSKHTTLRRL